MTTLEMSLACEEQPSLAEALDAEAAAIKELEEAMAAVPDISPNKAKADISRPTPVVKGGRLVATPGSAKRLQAKAVQPSQVAGKNVEKKLTTEERELLQVQAERAEMQKLFEARNKRYRNAAVVTAAPSTPKGKTSAGSLAKTSSTPTSKSAAEGATKVNSSNSSDRKESVRRRCEAKPDTKASDKVPECRATEGKVPGTKGRPASLGKSLPTRQASPAPSSKVVGSQASDSRSPRSVTGARASTPGAQGSRLATSVSSTRLHSPSAGPAVAKVPTENMVPTTESRGGRCVSPRGAPSPRPQASGAAKTSASNRASTPSRSVRVNTPTVGTPALKRSASKGVSKASGSAVDGKASVSVTAQFAVDGKASVSVTAQIAANAPAPAEAGKAIEPLVEEALATEPASVSPDVIDSADAVAPTEGLVVHTEAPSTDVSPADVMPAETLQGEALAVEAQSAEASSVQVLPSEVPPAEALPAEVPIMETQDSESPPDEIQPAERPIADTSGLEVLEIDMSAEVLDAEFPSKLDISAEVPADMPLQGDVPIAQPAAIELDEVQMAKLYVHRLVACILGA